MSDHEDYEGLAAGYALHALEPEDEQRLAGHLVGCERCAHLVADTAAVGAALAGLVEPAEQVPPGLRRRIVQAAVSQPRDETPEDTVAADLPFPPVRDRGSARPSGDTGSAAEVDEHVPAAREVLPPGRKRLWRSRTASAVLAAAVAVGVAVPVTIASVRSSDSISAQESTLAQWLLAPDAREIRLRSPNGTSNTSAAAAVLTGSGLLLVADGMAVNDQARSVYVLWASSAGGRPQPIATFDVKGSGPVQVPVTQLPLATSKVSRVAVSVEPGRKAPAEPTKILMSGSVA